MPDDGHPIRGSCRLLDSWFKVKLVKIRNSRKTIRPSLQGWAANDQARAPNFDTTCFPSRLLLWETPRVHLHVQVDAAKNRNTSKVWVQFSNVAASVVTHVIVHTACWPLLRKWMIWASACLNCTECRPILILISDVPTAQSSLRCCELQTRSVRQLDLISGSRCSELEVLWGIKQPYTGRI